MVARNLLIMMSGDNNMHASAWVEHGYYYYNSNAQWTKHEGGEVGPEETSRIRMWMS